MMPSVDLHCRTSDCTHAEILRTRKVAPESCYQMLESVIPRCPDGPGACDDSTASIYGRLKDSVIEA